MIQTVNIDSFTVSATTTEQSKVISWTVPTLPSNIRVLSQTLQILCSKPSKGNFNISLNNNILVAGTQSTINLGTNIINIATLKYQAGNKNAVGNMNVSNLVYTIEYEIAKPIITIISNDKAKIGVNDRCTIAFRCDMDLIQWEARATLNEIDDGHGVGLLVESGGPLTANTTAYVYVDTAELSNGDRKYRIDIYGQDSSGVWSDG